MMIWMLASALAQEPANAADPQDLRIAVDDSAEVNWTRGVLEVTRSAQGRGVAATRKAVEASARNNLGAQVQDAVRNVQIDPNSQVHDRLDDSELGGLLRSRAGRWAVGETRYYASGRIEVIAEVPLVDLLKPVSLAVSIARPEGVREPAITGVLIDARGTGVRPAWFPEVQTPAGQVLWDGALWDDQAVTGIPVVWVSDPAHLAAARVGDDPLIVQAERGDAGVIVLTAEDAVRFRTTLHDSDVLREAHTVVVVDP